MLNQAKRIYLDWREMKPDTKWILRKKWRTLEMVNIWVNTKYSSSFFLLKKYKFFSLSIYVYIVYVIAKHIYCLKQKTFSKTV